MVPTLELLVLQLQFLSSKPQLLPTIHPDQIEFAADSCGVTWKTTYLVLGKVDVHRQPHYERSKTLIPHQCKDRKLIDHLIDYTCS